MKTSPSDKTSLPHRLERRLFIGAATVVGVSALAPAALAQPDLVVVVHAKTAVKSLSRGELSAIFTTKMRNFDGGARIIPLNLPPRDSVRVEFDQKVLGMSPDEVARYWVDRRVRGGNAPPKHVPQTILLGRLVARLPGAIGYVPRHQVPAGVRVVATVG